MKYLITGGMGFIGRHLAKRLLEAGHYVCVLDWEMDLPIRESLVEVGGDRVWFERGDVCDEQFLDNVFCDSEPDRIYHLAAIVGPGRVVENYCGMIDEAKALSVLSQYEVPVIFASSSEVYGTSGTPLHEDCHLTIGTPSKKRSGYAAVKAYGEHVMMERHDRGLPSLIVRFFNVAGPGQYAGEDGCVIPRWASALMQGRPIKVSDGHMRSFMHIGQAVHALTELENTPGAWGQVTNIAADSRMLMRDIAEKMVMHVEEVYGLHPELEAFAPEGDQVNAAMFRDRRPSLVKLADLTGLIWANRVDQIIEDVCAEQAKIHGINKVSQEKQGEG